MHSANRDGNRDNTDEQDETGEDLADSRDTVGSNGLFQFYPLNNEGDQTSGGRYSGSQTESAFELSDWSYPTETDNAHQRTWPQVELHDAGSNAMVGYIREHLVSENESETVVLQPSLQVMIPEITIVTPSHHDIANAQTHQVPVFPERGIERDTADFREQMLAAPFMALLFLGHYLHEANEPPDIQVEDESGDNPTLRLSNQNQPNDSINQLNIFQSAPSTNQLQQASRNGTTPNALLQTFLMTSSLLSDSNYEIVELQPVGFIRDSMHGIPRPILHFTSCRLDHQPEISAEAETATVGTADPDKYVMTLLDDAYHIESEPAPQTQLLWPILFCLCNPVLALFPLTFSVVSRKAANQGDIPTAEKYSKAARTTLIIMVGLHVMVVLTIVGWVIGISA